MRAALGCKALAVFARSETLPFIHLKKPPPLAVVMFCGLCLNFFTTKDTKDTKDFFYEKIKKTKFFPDCRPGRFVLFVSFVVKLLLALTLLDWSSVNKGKLENASHPVQSRGLCPILPTHLLGRWLLSKKENESRNSFFFKSQIAMNI